MAEVCGEDGVRAHLVRNVIRECYQVLDALVEEDGTEAAKKRLLGGDYLAFLRGTGPMPERMQRLTGREADVNHAGDTRLGEIRRRAKEARES